MEKQEPWNWDFNKDGLYTEWFGSGENNQEAIEKIKKATVSTEKRLQKVREERADKLKQIRERNL